jgi:uncharacterized protein (TIGR03492 family)
MPSRLLVLSNGHGEDIIARSVIRSLLNLPEEVRVSVLPLVGVGQAFDPLEKEGGISRLGPRQALPSGGFSNQSLAGLLRDIGAGLPLLSWRQWRVVRRWGVAGQPILAVGDLLPLALASAAGGAFGFIGTPKSDYTWRSDPPAGWGSTPLADGYHRCKGSEWDPWEWALMKHHRCRLVAVRDALTARGLRHHGVRACAPGNPMMDGFHPSPLPAWLKARRRLLLLPGSRMPEAQRNFRALLQGLAGNLPPSTILVTTGNQPSPAHLAPALQAEGFHPWDPPIDSGASAGWCRGDLTLVIGRNRFQSWAPWAELGLANAGTATEQLVGLGIACLSLPGAGPQFTGGFARRQARLLGGAVIPCHSPGELGERLSLLLADEGERGRLGRRGRQRMGAPGGSERLARLIGERLLRDSSGT